MRCVSPLILVSGAQTSTVMQHSSKYLQFLLPLLRRRLLSRNVYSGICSHFEIITVTNVIACSN